MLTRFIFHSSTPSAQGLTELSAAATTPPAKEVSIGDVAKEADGAPHQTVRGSTRSAKQERPSRRVAAPRPPARARLAGASTPWVS